MTQHAATPFDLMQRLAGDIRELPGEQHHPAIQWAHLLCGLGAETPDEIAWCSSGLNLVVWLFTKASGQQVPRSKSAAARSWLALGRPVSVEQALAGFDVVILKRGVGTQPGPEVLDAPGHVGLFAGYDRLTNTVHVLGANQGNAITVAPFKDANVLGVRRLA